MPTAPVPANPSRKRAPSMSRGEDVEQRLAKPIRRRPQPVPVGRLEIRRPLRVPAMMRMGVTFVGIRDQGSGLGRARRVGVRRSALGARSNQRTRWTRSTATADRDCRPRLPTRRPPTADCVYPTPDQPESLLPTRSYERRQRLRFLDVIQGGDGFAPRLLHQLMIAQEVADAERRHSGLARAEEVARVRAVRGRARR